MAQMGAGRAGWYSWDVVDNGGQPSASEILPELQQIRTGDILPALPGVKDCFVVATAVPEHDLILTVPTATGEPRATWEFLLKHLDRQRTRLVVRGRVSARWLADQPESSPWHKGLRPVERVYAVLGKLPWRLVLPLAYFGHRVMQARQLRGIKRRAEQ